MIPIIISSGESTHAIACTEDGTITVMITETDTTVVEGSRDAHGMGEGMGVEVGIVRHGMVMAETTTTAETTITEDIALLGRKRTRQSIRRRTDGAD
jgi:hypothetical protein